MMIDKAELVLKLSGKEFVFAPTNHCEDLIMILQYKTDLNSDTAELLQENRYFLIETTLHGESRMVTLIFKRY